MTAIFTREDLSSAQQMVGHIAADFMRTEVLPLVEQIYAKDWSLTRELLLKAGELDLLRVDIPEAYGGLGLDKVSSAYVGEQIAVIPSFAGSLGAHTTIGTLPIVYFGNESQKERYLPKLASGEMIGAYALTEPGSGSDALAASTKATLTEDGKHYVLNGQKAWITNGGFADLFTIFAKIDGKHFTAFIVERGMGVISGAEEHKLGLDGNSTTALMFDDVQVPVENVLGTVGEGHKVAFNILNLGRVKLGTRNIGGAKQALSAAVKYAIGRKQFGQSIASFGLIKHKIAEMSVRCFVGDAMVFRSLGEVDAALSKVDANDGAAVLKEIEEFAIECSINKVWSSEALAYVVDEALQVYGGNGYSREFPAERAYRDARITRIYEGTNEINRLIVGTRLAKSPVLAASIEGAGAIDGAEGTLLARAKHLTLSLFGQAVKKYGKGFSSEQEVVARLADMAIEIYALESAMLRADKIGARNGSHAAVAAEMVGVFGSDSVDRLTHAAKNVLSAIAGADAGAAIQQVHTLLHHAPIDTIAARRRIADAIIEANRYPL